MNTELAGDFYDALAPLFDVMTDWEDRLAGEMPFLREILRQSGARDLLDAACGSGGHALALAREGWSVSGADISPVMVGLAQAKAAAERLEVHFVRAGLDELPEKAQGPFDVVLCLGNSLPHLLRDEDLLAGLKGIAAVLRPGGVLVTQSLNYDLRWQRRPRFFQAQGGEWNGQEVLVWRFADYLDEARQIAFHIALFHKGDKGWSHEVHTTLQRPLFQAELAGALGEAGFDGVESYGAMTSPAPEFDAGGSGDLVVVARKR